MLTEELSSKLARVALANIKREYPRHIQHLSTIAEEELAQRFAGYIAASPYPIRSGAHGNTAFACVLALDYARASSNTALEFEIRKAARRWYGADRNAPIAYEPSLDDFLSPGLIEAVLMQVVMEPGEFMAWGERFAPQGFGALA